MVKRFILGAALALMSSVAVAQDAYVGVTLDYGDPAGGPGEIATGILGGLRFGDGGLSYGAEFDMDLIGSSDFDASRLRGVVYNDMGKFGLFATMGATRFDLDAGGSETGLNAGLGADYELRGNMSLRAEAIRDYMPDAPDVTTLRLGVTFGF